MAFILINLSGVELKDNLGTSAIVQKIGIFWPVLPENYNRIVAVGKIGVANNYFFFLLSVWAYSVLFMSKVISRFRVKYYLEKPNFFIDVMFIFLGAISYYICSRLDIVGFEFESAAKFHLDPFGMYYIGQYFGVILIAFCFSITIIFLMKIFQAIPNRSSRGRAV